MSNGYEMNAGEQPVVWEMRLLAPEPPARREMPPVVQPDAAHLTAAGISDERKIEQAAAAFAEALIGKGYEAAHGMLAPWLQQQVAPEQLRTILGSQFLADTKAGDFVLSANHSTLEELRAHYQEYYKGDASRTIASVEEFGDWGPPSMHIDDHIVPESFRQWMSLELTPELDDESGLDYILRLWLIVADVEGAIRIGHLEPGQ